MADGLLDARGLKGELAVRGGVALGRLHPGVSKDYHISSDLMPMYRESPRWSAR